MLNDCIEHFKELDHDAVDHESAVGHDAFFRSFAKALKKDYNTLGQDLDAPQNAIKPQAAKTPTKESLIEETIESMLNYRLYIWQLISGSEDDLDKTWCCRVSSSMYAQMGDARIDSIIEKRYMSSGRHAPTPMEWMEKATAIMGELTTAHSTRTMDKESANSVTPALSDAAATVACGQLIQRFAQLAYQRRNNIASKSDIRSLMNNKPWIGFTAGSNTTTMVIIQVASDESNKLIDVISETSPTAVTPRNSQSKGAQSEEDQHYEEIPSHVFSSSANTVLAVLASLKRHSSGANNGKDEGEDDNPDHHNSNSNDSYTESNNSTAELALEDPSWLDEDCAKVVMARIASTSGHAPKWLRKGEYAVVKYAVLPGELKCWKAALPSTDEEPDPSVPCLWSTTQKTLHTHAGYRLRTNEDNAEVAVTVDGARDPSLLQVVQYPWEVRAPLCVIDAYNELLTPNGTRKFIKHLDAAVRRLHKRGICHGDIHAGNVVVRYDDRGFLRPLIIDFGLARQFRDHPDSTSYLTRIESSLSVRGQELADSDPVLRRWQPLPADDLESVVLLAKWLAGSLAADRSNNNKYLSSTEKAKLIPEAAKRWGINLGLVGQNDRSFADGKENEAVSMASSVEVEPKKSLFLRNRIHCVEHDMTKMASSEKRRAAH